MKSLALTATILIFLFLAYPIFGANTYSITLDGTDQCLYRADTASLSVTGNLTIEMWVKMTGNPGAAWDILLEKSGGSGNRGYELRYYQPGSVDTIVFRLSQNGTTRYTVTWAETLPQNTWIHVALVFNTAATANATLYLNSSFVSTQNTTAAGIFDSTEKLAIGCNSIALDDNFLPALVDEVRVWNRLRSGAEIAANYKKELIGDEAGLVGYWKMEQNANDSQTSGLNDLTEQNAPSYTTDIPVWLAVRRRIQTMIQ